MKNLHLIGIVVKVSCFKCLKIFNTNLNEWDWDISGTHKDKISLSIKCPDCGAKEDLVY